MNGIGLKASGEGTKITIGQGLEEKEDILMPRPQPSS